MRWRSALKAVISLRNLYTTYPHIGLLTSMNKFVSLYHLVAGDNTVETDQGLNLVYMHAGTNPFEVINQAVK